MAYASIKQKTINGLKWSFIDSIANQGLQFIIGIILARLLEPEKFGLIGMLTIFISVSQVFIDSGFGQAIIRKQDCKQIDLNTVFFFNLVMSIFLYFCLFFNARYVGLFFNQPALCQLLKVLGVVLIINAFGLIQRTLVNKEVDFKLQSKISIISSIISGVLAIWMAAKGYGVWSLVYKSISMQLITTLLFWIFNSWRPSFDFSIKSLRKLFQFSSKLLASSLLDIIYRNVYYLIIGKYFSFTELGYYTRANEFQNIPSANLTQIINRVSYPIISTIQDDPEKIKAVYKKMIKGTMFLSFMLMFGLAACSKQVILLTIGEKWLPAAEFLQILCLSGVFYPLHALNLNVLVVKGHSDIFLKLEVIKKILIVPTIIIGIHYGIRIMLITMVINSIIAYFLNSKESGKLIGYSSWAQLKDIFPSFIISVIMVAGVLGIGTFQMNTIFLLLLQVSIGAFIVVLSSLVMKDDSYVLFKEFLVGSMRK